jgi:hypothetical protein
MDKCLILGLSGSVLLVGNVVPVLQRLSTWASQREGRLELPQAQQESSS